MSLATVILEYRARPARRRWWRIGPLRLVGWTVLGLLAAANIVPFLWVVLSSFKPGSEINAAQLTLFPHAWTLENYRNMASNMSGFGSFYLNSFLVTSATVVLTVLIGSLAAFAFARFEFRGRHLLFYVLVFAMFLPAEMALIGRFELFQQLRLLNKLSGLTLAYTAGELAIVLFIMRNAFMAVPQEMIDAARIDGASTWQIYWEVMVPMSRAGLVAAALLVFMAAWNEFLLAVTITWSERAQTLPVGIMLLRGQFEHWDYGMLYATLMLSFLPVMVLFIALQRHFMRGVAAGALKG